MTRKEEKKGERLTTTMIRNGFGPSMIKIWLFLLIWLPCIIAKGGHAGGGHAGGGHAGGGHVGGGHGSESGSDGKKGSGDSKSTTEVSSSDSESESSPNSNSHSGSKPGSNSNSHPNSKPGGKAGSKPAASSRVNEEGPSASQHKKTAIGHHTSAYAVCNGNSKSSSSHQRRSTVQQVLPTISLNRDNNSLYYTNVSIGTPGQKQPLVIDIVEPYNWVTHNHFESHDPISSNSSGSYQSNLSRTSQQVDGSHVFHLDFVDLDDINATAMMDKISFESLSLKNQSSHTINNTQNDGSGALYNSHSLTLSNSSFFEINDTTSSKGVLGLGGKINDKGTDIDSSQFDSSFFLLESLRDNGIIESLSYSLWLGGDTRPYYDVGRNVPDEINCGKLILGGVDPYYYSGPLKKFNNLIFLDSRTDMLSRGYPVLPMRTINVVSATGNSINVTNENFLTPVLLDSRYSFSHLPAETIVQIAVQVNAIYMKEVDMFVVSCKIADMGVNIQFEFGDVSIDVPFKDFLMSTHNPETNSTMKFSGGDEACFMTMVSSEETGFNILGTSFLRNVYLAVDHDDQSIAIAQARRKYTTLITPDGAGTSATASISHYLSPSLSSTGKATPIASGYIPYAVSSNETLSMTLSPSQPPETRIPDQFTATVFSNGLISTGRSFYNTYRSTSSSSTVPTDFASFTVTSAQRTSYTGQQGNKGSNAYRLKPPEIANKYWISHIFLLAGSIMLVMIW